MPKANLDHTISRQGAGISTLDHPATTPRVLSYDLKVSLSSIYLIVLVRLVSRTAVSFISTFWNFKKVPFCQHGYKLYHVLVTIQPKLFEWTVCIIMIFLILTLCMSNISFMPWLVAYHML